MSEVVQIGPRPKRASLREMVDAVSRAYFDLDGSHGVAIEFYGGTPNADILQRVDRMRQTCELLERLEEIGDDFREFMRRHVKKK